MVSAGGGWGWGSDTLGVILLLSSGSFPVTIIPSKHVTTFRQEVDDVNPIPPSIMCDIAKSGGEIISLSPSAVPSYLPVDWALIGMAGSSRWHNSFSELPVALSEAAGPVKSVHDCGATVTGPPPIMCAKHVIISVYT